MELHQCVNSVLLAESGSLELHGALLFLDTYLTSSSCNHHELRALLLDTTMGSDMLKRLIILFLHDPESSASSSSERSLAINVLKQIALTLHCVASDEEEEAGLISSQQFFDGIARHIRAVASSIEHEISQARGSDAWKAAFDLVFFGMELVSRSYRSRPDKESQHYGISKSFMWAMIDNLDIFARAIGKVMLDASVDGLVLLRGLETIICAILDSAPYMSARAETKSCHALAKCNPHLLFVQFCRKHHNKTKRAHALLYLAAIYRHCCRCSSSPWHVLLTQLNGLDLSDMFRSLSSTIKVRVVIFQI